VFDCVVEHFGEQGASIAGMRINVCELPQPVNGSHFIQTSALTGKLLKQLTVP